MRPVTTPTTICHDIAVVLPAAFSAESARAEAEAEDDLVVIAALLEGLGVALGALLIIGVIDAGARTPALGDGMATQSDEDGTGWAEGVGEAARA